MKRVLIIFMGILATGIMEILAIEPVDTINIEQVVVTGNRVEVARVNSPVSISVISSEEIRNQEESNVLPVVAKMTPGLFISETGVSGYALHDGSSGQITIRGVGGKPNARVMILVDGQPQYMGVFGHPLPNFHMASNVERVEVVRGPSSLLYGSNAMGGVINIISKKNQNNGLSFNGHAAYGSFNTLKTGASLAYSKDKITVGVNFNHDETAGHRDSSAFDITNIHAFAVYEINKNWSAKGGFTIADYSFQDPGSVLDSASRTFMGDITRKMATVSVRNNYEKTRGGFYGFYNSGIHNFSDGWLSNDVNTGINIYQSVDFGKGGTITAGLDIKSYGGEGSKGFFADTFITVNETAGYLLAEQQLGKKINLSAGARLENHSNFGLEVVPQFGLIAKPLKRTTIRGLVSKGFRSPTIMEMYLFAPNADLGPERLWNYEISASQRIGWSGIIRATAFVISGSNLIVMQPNPNPGPPMIRVNGGEFTNKGIELESSFQPNEQLKVDLNYSGLLTDTKIYFAPEHQFYAGAVYTYGDFSLALNMKAIAGLYTYIDKSDEHADIKESYLLLNTKLRYNAHKNLELYIAGKNLLNQNYQTVYGYPMPGITFIAGISFSLNSK